MRSKTPLQAEKILSAAARLFATHRFHEARMEDIAALAEVGKGTLYRYFKDKDELYLALLEGASAGLAVRLGELVCQAAASCDQLAAVATALLTYFDENPHLIDLIQHAEAMQKPDQEAPWQKMRNATACILRRIFTCAAARGEFVIEDPELAILMFMGGLRSVMRFGDRPRDPDLSARIIQHFLHGFARRCGECPPPYAEEGTTEREILPGFATSLMTPD